MWDRVHNDFLKLQDRKMLPLQENICESNSLTRHEGEKYKFETGGITTGEES